MARQAWINPNLERSKKVEFEWANTDRLKISLAVI